MIFSILVIWYKKNQLNRYLFLVFNCKLFKWLFKFGVRPLVKDKFSLKINFLLCGALQKGY